MELEGPPRQYAGHRRKRYSVHRTRSEFLQCLHVHCGAIARVPIELIDRVEAMQTMHLCIACRFCQNRCGGDAGLCLIAFDEGSCGVGPLTVAGAVRRGPIAVHMDFHI